MKKRRDNNISYAEAVREIITLSKNNPAWSYYDIEAYAFDHDKEDWLSAMKNPRTREIIALYVEENHSETGIPYMNDLSITEARYYERHDSSK